MRRKLRSGTRKDTRLGRVGIMKRRLSSTLKQSRINQIISRPSSTEGLPMINWVTTIQPSRTTLERSKLTQRLPSLITIRGSASIAKGSSKKLSKTLQKPSSSNLRKLTSTITEGSPSESRRNTARLLGITPRL